MPGIEPGDEDRVHSEAPAEGEEQEEAEVVRAHSEDPAEGPDTD